MSDDIVPNTGLSDGLGNITPPSDLQKNSEISFITIVVAIIISWILVAFWTRSFENLFYVKLGFDSDSFWQTTFVALSITIGFFVLIWFVDQYGLISNRGSDSQQELEAFGSPIIGGLGGVTQDNPNFQNNSQDSFQNNFQNNFQDERNSIFI